MRSRELPSAERFLVDNALDLLEATEARIEAADQELLKTAAIEEQAKLLMTIPGVGVTVAMGLLAAIGDIRRFPSPEQLACYFGLVPRVSQSAGRCHHGSITKAGPGNARSLAIEAAQILARSPAPIATTFHRLRRKRDYNVAVTALARKLIVLVWYMLQNGEPYRCFRSASSNATSGWPMNQAMVEEGVDDDLRVRLVQAFFQTADWMRNRPETSAR